MKIRNGFVSNSSSSSFVVAFKTVPTSVEEVKKMLFGDINSIDIYGYNITADQMAKVVFEDMQENGAVIDNKEIAKEVNSGWFPGMPDYDYNWKDRLAREEYYEKCDKAAEKLADEFMESNRGSSFFIFEYSDNDGPLYSTMEHGDIFSRLPHICISKH
jgi:hypothetical protein